VKWGEAAGVLLAWGVWRPTGLASAGRVVARALASSDETTRTLSGVLLVRGGARALPLLRTNLQGGVAVPMTLRVLGDVGGAEALHEIEPHLKSTNAAVAHAATDAMRAAQVAAPPRAS